MIASTKIASTKSFFALTAGELMTRSVVMVPLEMSLKGAAHLLSQARVTGGPVVDGSGRCVGVLSAVDFMHCAEKDRDSAQPFGPAAAVVTSEWQVMDLDNLPTDEVAAYMTPDPVTVRVTTSVTELARAMLDAHIHRLIVVDSSNKPIGVVSTTDILAAVAHAPGRHEMGGEP
jgi:predicted transcriptional regulator